jgi:hypothetical protein
MAAAAAVVERAVAMVVVRAAGKKAAQGEGREAAERVGAMVRGWLAAMEAAMVVGTAAGEGTQVVAGEVMAGEVAAGVEAAAGSETVGPEAKAAPDAATGSEAAREAAAAARRRFRLFLRMWSRRTWKSDDCSDGSEAAAGSAAAAPADSLERALLRSACSATSRLSSAPTTQAWVWAVDAGHRINCRCALSSPSSPRAIFSWPAQYEPGLWLPEQERLPHPSVPVNVRRPAAYACARAAWPFTRPLHASHTSSSSCTRHSAATDPSAEPRPSPSHSDGRRPLAAHRAWSSAVALGSAISWSARRARAPASPSSSPPHRASSSRASRRARMAALAVHCDSRRTRLASGARFPSSSSSLAGTVRCSGCAC